MTHYVVGAVKTLDLNNCLQNRKAGEEVGGEEDRMKHFLHISTPLKEYLPFKNPLWYPWKSGLFMSMFRVILNNNTPGFLDLHKSLVKHLHLPQSGGNLRHNVFKMRHPAVPALRHCTFLSLPESRTRSSQSFVILQLTRRLKGS